MAITKEDPTGLVKTRRRAGLRIGKRLTNAQAKIKIIFRNIPRTKRIQKIISNQEQAVIFDYDLNADELQRLYIEIRAIINAELETEQAVMLEPNAIKPNAVSVATTFKLTFNAASMEPFWWWMPVIEQPFRQGTIGEINQFNTLIDLAITEGITVRGGTQPQPIKSEQVMQSTQYKKELRSVQVSNYTVIKSLSDQTSGKVIQVLNQGIQAGDKPSVIANVINKMFDIARSNANRIAQTEINKAFNDAKIAANQVASELTGLNYLLLHISALLPTTRFEHAARHGRKYTAEQQLQWWNTGSNRINCKCSTKSTLVDNSGNVVDTEPQEELKSERSFFE